MNIEEKIKCKMLYKVLESELEACFDVNYESEFKTLDERVVAFENIYTQYTAEYGVADLIRTYGLAYFVDQNVLNSEDLEYLKLNNKF